MTFENQERPDCERAHHFAFGFCNDPECGLHIIGFREDGEPVIEIVMSPDQTLGVIEACKVELYDKVSRRI